MPETLRNPTERPTSPETIKPSYDAILVHGYWLTDKAINTVGDQGETVSTRHATFSALRTHFAVRAAALAYDEGRGAEKIVVDMGYWWGPNYPSQGELVKKTLVDKYHIPLDAIILKEEAFSTYREVGFALELAKERGWTRILDIAFGAHQKTTRRIYDNKDYEDLRKPDLVIEDRSVEEILENDDQRISYALHNFTWSRYGFSYQIYEGLKWTRMHLPKFDYKKLEQQNRDSRTGPIEDWQPPIISKIPILRRALRFDKYNLPPKEKVAA